MIKYTNTQKTAAQFNGAFFSLAAPEDFESIGDGPTREAVLDWLSQEGNVPTPYVAPPEPPKPFTSLEYLDLFTEAEQLAVATAAMTNASAKLWYDRMLAANFITLADERTEAGLDALVAAGLITSARRTAIVGLMQ